MPWGAAIAAAASLAGSIGGGLMQSNAADTQAQAANQASANQMAMYQQTRSDLLPYMNLGTGASGQLASLVGLPGAGTGGSAGYGGTGSSVNNAATGQQVLAALKAHMGQGISPNLVAQIQSMVSSGAPLTNIQAVLSNWAQHTTSGGNQGAVQDVMGALSSPVMTQPTAQAPGNAAGGSATGNSMLDTLRNYPGYQWAFNQGLTALDRSAASKGLLLSGGQVKDAQTYGQGMADQLFNQYYNQLMGTTQLGENAAAQTGSSGQNAATNAGNFAVSGANASATGQIGMANSLFGQGGALQNALTAYQLTQQPSSGSGSMSPNQFASMGALSVSDRRAKTDIKPVGHTDSGLPIYTFRYKGSNLPQMGVMAQDVENLAPHLVHEIAGVKTVDYDGISRLPPMRMVA